MRRITRLIRLARYFVGVERLAAGLTAERAELRPLRQAGIETRTAIDMLAICILVAGAKGEPDIRAQRRRNGTDAALLTVKFKAVAYSKGHNVMDQMCGPNDAQLRL